jgi:DNA (cytosine-5)-methyltransferase 1
MTQSTLVLSLFPGIGMLDTAFEAEGFTIVRGPDVLWGGDIRRFHPPPGRFDGVIGGPPCQAHSRFRHLAKRTGQTAPDLIPEFSRCVNESQPQWFLMENVPDSPDPVCPGYEVSILLLNNRWIGEEQNRLRKFRFGCRGYRRVLAPEIPVFENPRWAAAILASGGRKPGTERKRGKTKGHMHGYVGRQSYAFALEQQGLPPDFLSEAPFTAAGKYRVVGNGVPIPMGRAIAKAVRRAIES